MIPLLTIDHVPGRQIEIVGSGLIVEHQTFGLNVVRDFLAGLTDFFGGQAGSYDSLTLSKVQAMIDTIMRRAMHEGAEAVIGIQATVRPFPAKRMSMVQVTFTGTMVRYSDTNSYSNRKLEHDGRLAPTSASPHDAPVL
ncbi:MAG: hypothetical protein NPIRA02_01170 [Nitrospirales bacterium]|nr:MAG: hypothetical protein NPIRA02_01170 [Nitrospirales bacterium]